MSNFTVCIDIDNTLSHFQESVIAEFNKKYNKNISIEDFKSYDIYKFLSFEDANTYSKLWDDENVILSTDVVSGAKYGVKHFIDMGYDVVIATASSPIAYLHKVEWIKKHFPFIDEFNIICVNDKSLIRCDVMIDDCAEQLISNMMCNRVLVDQPWNRTVHDEAYGIHRCKDWPSIVDAVDNIFKEENG